MWFAVISIFPDMFNSISQFGITSRAIQNHLVDIDCINPRDFATGNYKRIDDRPVGGGAGMVMMPEPLKKSIIYAKELAQKKGLKDVPVMYMSPQGKTLNETSVTQYAHHHDGFIIICGRYDGIDERIIKNYVDIECSIGDFVLSGGELPAMVLMDSIIRKLPNVMGDDDSVINDSFVSGLLDYPLYTKPVDFDGDSVPDVLLSGHHGEIAKWRFLAQYQQTCQKRPDLIEAFTPNKQQKKWLDLDKD